jgi:hypothetical protein
VPRAPASTPRVPCSVLPPPPSPFPLADTSSTRSSRRSHPTQQQVTSTGSSRGPGTRLLSAGQSMLRHQAPLMRRLKPPPLPLRLSRGPSPRASLRRRLRLHVGSLSECLRKTGVEEVAGSTGTGSSTTGTVPGLQQRQASRAAAAAAGGPRRQSTPAAPRGHRRCHTLRTLRLPGLLSPSWASPCRRCRCLASAWSLTGSGSLRSTSSTPRSWRRSGARW